MNAPAQKGSKGARVLDDKVTDPMTGTVPVPQAPVAEAKGNKKKNQNIEVHYIDKDMKDGNDPAGSIGLHVVVKGQIDEVILFADLKPEIAIAGLAFGLNTVYRNTFNSKYNARGVMADAVDALIARHQGFQRGEWTPEGEGGEGGTPLIIEAIRRAYKEIGKTDAEADKAAEDSLAKYRALDSKEAKATQVKAWMKRGKIEIAYEAIKSERAAERLAKAKAASGQNAADDLADL